MVGSVDGSLNGAQADAWEALGLSESAGNVDKYQVGDKRVVDVGFHTEGEKRKKTELCAILAENRRAYEGQLQRLGIPISPPTKRTIKNDVGVVQQGVVMCRPSFLSDQTPHQDTETLEQNQAQVKAQPLATFSNQDDQGGGTPAPLSAKLALLQPTYQSIVDQLDEIRALKEKDRSCRAALKHTEALLEQARREFAREISRTKNELYSRSLH
mmetsp:Transcript_35860/g.57167  ORF Transcript_35860/g.57167 Transcript_35860/m.57167 type:complete len:213 (+) Transcript_35860:206-844(+)